MKQLLLIRHGKSSWDDPSLSDFERPLNDRGRGDAPVVAAALRDRGVLADGIVSSPAERAASTARMVAGEIGFSAEEIALDERLYLASPGVVLRVIQDLDESWNTALIFGHNPAMHEAVDLLASDAGVERFPTLAVARLEVRVGHWGEVDEGSARLVELLVPKELH